jgi:hypothetical protein
MDIKRNIVQTTNNIKVWDLERILPKGVSFSLD